MKVSAIVPAYNEAERIGPILEVLTKTPILDEVIVIDDGSKDETVSIAKKYPVKLLLQETNQGKGKAMERGVQEAQGEVIFFCDADIKGITPDIIEKTVSPVLGGKLDMYILMRDRLFHHLPFSRYWVPKFGGERALTKKLWQSIPAPYKNRFEIEVALNFYAYHYGKFDYFVSPEVSQTIKEKKYGLWHGLNQRQGMMRNIFYGKTKLWGSFLKKKIMFK